MINFSHLITQVSAAVAMSTANGTFGDIDPLGIYLAGETPDTIRYGVAIGWQLMPGSIPKINEFAFNYWLPDMSPGGWPVGTGDFNNDGWTDAALQVDNGSETEVWIIYHSGNQSIGVLAVDQPLAADQAVVGVGDFNGDGHPDVLLKDAAHTLSVWLLTGDEGTEFLEEIIIGKSTINGTDRYVGFADVNGDTLYDIVLSRTKKDLVFLQSTGHDVLRNGNGAPARFSLATLAKHSRLRGYGKVSVIGASFLPAESAPPYVLFLRENKANGMYSLWIYYGDIDSPELYPEAFQFHFRNASFMKPIGVMSPPP